MTSASASGWTVESTDIAERALARLDRSIQSRVVRLLETRVLPDPQRIGEPLRGSLKGLWRYRVGDYRVLCRLEHKKLIVLVVTIGHRRDVYRG